MAIFLLLGMAGRAPADDLQTLSKTCAGESDLWQQALGLDGAATAAAQSAPLCLDPTETQIAGGCCEGHGGPAGCDADTHRVLCADGKKSKSCSC